MDKLITYIEENRKRHLDQTFELLRMQTISADPGKSEEITKCGNWLVKMLSDMGFDNADLKDTGGLPAVYADWMHAGDDKPTILLYGHYDVQPAEPLDLWETPPFEPTIKDDRIYGRGTADDKCQIMMHVAALEALMKVDGKLPVNVKVFLESEEESGTGHTPQYVHDNPELLACDAIVISDTEVPGPNTPALIYGLRGIAFFEVKVKGTNRDLHSGRFGGIVRNPLDAMADIIAKLHDENGHITVPGIYDDVVKISDAEKKEFENLGDKDEELKSYLQVNSLWGEKGYTTYERVWARPALDVNGIWGGYMEEGAKTVIASEGGFKISMRLVPNQDPKKIYEQLKKYIEEICPSGVTVDVACLHGGDPLLVPLDDPFVLKAKEALTKAFDRPTLMIREGGSIPITADFKKALGAPCVMMGLDVPEGNIHAPNENFRLDHFYTGIRAAAYFYLNCADIKK